MSDKQDALRVIQGLPDDCSTDDILAERFFQEERVIVARVVHGAREFRTALGSHPWLIA
jgi:hypothetical protein